MWSISTNLLSIPSQPQNFGTKALLLFLLFTFLTEAVILGHFENMHWFISVAMFWSVSKHLFVFFISFCWLKEVVFQYVHLLLVMYLYS